MNTNSENPAVGKAFQKRVLGLLDKLYATEFKEECAILIGNPSKEHKFDIVSKDKKIVVECKCYTWTNGNNVPSAKMSKINEAVLFMKYLPIDTKKIIVLKKDIRKSTGESLANYYCRTYEHLLDDISIWEVSDIDSITVVRDGKQLMEE